MGARNTSFVAHDSLLPSLAVENLGKSFDRESFVDLFILCYIYFLDLEKVCSSFIEVFPNTFFALILQQHIDVP